MLSVLLFALFLAVNGQQYNYYFGNLHAHSNYSDGCQDRDSSGVRTPAQCYAFAKRAKNLNFLGLSEHNHREAGLSDWNNWHKGRLEADSANVDGEFVALYGTEFGLNEFGHVLIYGIDQLIGWEDSSYNVFCDKNDYNSLWKIIDSLNGFATLAHPKRRHYLKLAKNKRDSIADKVIFGTAIRNGPSSSKDSSYIDRPRTSYLSYYKRLLALGYRVGPTIDHDNHNTTFGRTAASRTVVLALQLSRESIVDAYRCMRFYACEDWNAQVSFSIRGKPMGSELRWSSAPLIRVTVTDPDLRDKCEYIRIFFGRSGSGAMPKVLASSRTVNYIVARHQGIRKKENWYYFAEVKQKDGDVIITSPIWVSR